MTIWEALKSHQGEAEPTSQLQPKT
jgi:hypothetical protein